MEIQEITNAPSLTSDSYIPVAVPNGAGGFVTGKATIAELASAILSAAGGASANVFFHDISFDDDRQITITNGVVVSVNSF
jgi:hypothetical protein